MIFLICLIRYFKRWQNKTVIVFLYSLFQSNKKKQCARVLHKPVDDRNILVFQRNDLKTQLLYDIVIVIVFRNIIVIIN
jgi:hypothetical protein